MKITDLIAGNGTAFSFEILPPLKGAGVERLRQTIDNLREFDPKYINITNHRSEAVFKDVGNGLLERYMVRRRPGTVAVAAVLQNEYKIPLVPHVLCSGYSKTETEYLLIDLKILGIRNLLVLRGDKAREDKRFIAEKDGYSHATELQEQVNLFNQGMFVDGTPMKEAPEPFSYGVACYPEKHEEAPNIKTDAGWFCEKVRMGAEYGVTQMFFDNRKYFEFVKYIREMGVTVPIIPGIKPITRLSQLTVLPKVFHCDLPVAFTDLASKCKTDEDVRRLGIEWCVQQCRELKEYGVPSIHFYSNGAWQDIYEVAKEVY